MGSGKTVMMATGESGGFDDLIWSALPGLHTIALSLSHVAGKPYGALYALYSRRKLSHVELELLELLAGHAGVALTNAMAFEEVVRQRAHERAVIDGSADGIAVLDEAGLVRQWNPAAHRITGTAAADAIGKPPSFPLPEPGSTLTHKLPNGRWLDVLCTSLADGGGELVIDFRDVTAAKELEEAKDLFLATTSHELRTPITVVQGFASTLASRWDQLARHRTAGRGADHRRAGRVARPAGGAAAARLAGRRRPAAGQQRPVRPGRRPARGRHRVPAAVGQARGGGRHPGRPAPASGDTMATDIIVGQLLENAFKYSPDGGTVSVRARVAGELDRGHGGGRGHRHRRRRPRAHLRPVLPGRGRRPAPVRRRRHRACSSSAAWPRRSTARSPPARGPQAAPHVPAPAARSVLRPPPADARPCRALTRWRCARFRGLVPLARLAAGGFQVGVDDRRARRSPAA